MPDEKLSELIERVERASGRDRETDLHIHAALVRHGRIEHIDWGCIGDRVRWSDDPVTHTDWPEGWPYEYCGDWPHYTGSLDACLALVERVRPEHQWFMQKLAYIDGVYQGGKAGFHLQPPTSSGWTIDGYAATPPLAVLSALLRSMGEKT